MTDKSSLVWNEYPGERPTTTKLAPVLGGDGLASDEKPGNTHVGVPVLAHSASLTFIVAGQARCVQELAKKELPYDDLATDRRLQRCTYRRKGGGFYETSYL
jgi:hypothetical protein